MLRSLGFLLRGLRRKVRKDGAHFTRDSIFFNTHRNALLRLPEQRMTRAEALKGPCLVVNSESDDVNGGPS